MKMPTMKAPISELAPIAKSALKQLRERADKKWNEIIDVEWEKMEGKRWYWIGPEFYKSREDLETRWGKVDKLSQMRIGSEFQRIYTQTRQISTYKDFVKLYNNKPDAIVTLRVETYNVLMTWDD